MVYTFDFASFLHGIYTLEPKTIYGLPHWTTEDNQYGIWYDGLGSRWVIGQNSPRGTYYTYADDKNGNVCIHDIEAWTYYDGVAWVDAGKGINVECVASKFISIVSQSKFENLSEIPADCALYE